MKKEQEISQWLRTSLIHEMRCGMYRGMKRLPPELKVAQDLGVSRTMLRDSLASLEREGFISRKHGIGTLVNLKVLGIRGRMDIDEEFVPMLQEVGKEPRQSYLRSHIISADEKTAEALEIHPGEPVFEVVRVIVADGKPAILCYDYFAKSMLTSKEYDEARLRAPIFEFLETYCGAHAVMDVSRVHAVRADAETAKLLELEKDVPVLYLEETDYDLWEAPVLFSRQFFADDAMEQVIVRRKL